MKNLEEIKNKFSKTADKLGKPIDPGIFDTVVYLNYLGITTSASCEGHLDHGIAGPWVDIDHPNSGKAHNELSLYRDKDDIKSFNKIREISKNARKLSLPLARKLILLLDEFYKNHSISEDSRLVINRLGFGQRLISQGSMFQDIRTQEENLEYLKKYQAEMKAFTEFLKSKVV